MTNDLERINSADEPDHSGSSAVPAAGVTECEPIIEARYFVVDASGKKREMVRTRSGREIPILSEDESEEFFKRHAYDPDL